MILVTISTVKEIVENVACISLGVNFSPESPVTVQTALSCLASVCAGPSKTAKTIDSLAVMRNQQPIWQLAGRLNHQLISLAASIGARVMPTSSCPPKKSMTPTPCNRRVPILPHCHFLSLHFANSLVILPPESPSGSYDSTSFSSPPFYHCFPDDCLILSRHP